MHLRVESLLLTAGWLAGFQSEAARRLPILLPIVSSIRRKDSYLVNSLD